MFGKWYENYKSHQQILCLGKYNESIIFLGIMNGNNEKSLTFVILFKAQNLLMEFIIFIPFSIHFFVSENPFMHPVIHTFISETYVASVRISIDR